MCIRDSVEEAAGEAPEVHGHDGVAGEICPGLAVVLGEAGVLAVLDDLGPLGDPDQVVVLVLLAHAAGYMAVLGDGVAPVSYTHLDVYKRQEEGGIHGQLGGTIPLTGKFPQDSSSEVSETDSKWVSHSDMENQMYTVLAFVMGYTGDVYKRQYLYHSIMCLNWEGKNAFESCTLLKFII